MEISASGSLSDGKYEKGSFSEVQVINNFTGASPSNCGPGSSATQIVCTVDLSGLPLIQLPKKQFNISATQTINMQRGDRKSVESGKRVLVRVNIGGRRNI